MIRSNYLARINCFQPIPCNPCETSCPFGAILIGEDITNIPVLDITKCRGCGICVAACPGIAITMAMVTGGDKDYVAIPYEYYPLPEIGDEVTVVDANGNELGHGIVEKLKKPNKNDPTTLVFVIVDSSITKSVVGIKKYIVKDDPIICRCEEIFESEIINAIKKGDRTVDAIKRRTRSGMGMCQGKTCNRLIANIIVRELGISLSEQLPSSKRPPVGVISIKELSQEKS
ncbi:MAG: (2Fe-2S)-binding protein [Firmicutes bacterium]|nr:(2Fe-2S)-binding protein [Bacillota bacterium]